MKNINRIEVFIHIENKTEIKEKQIGFLSDQKPLYCIVNKKEER